MPHPRPGRPAPALLALLLAAALAAEARPGRAADGPRPALPSVAEGWSIRLVAEAPTVRYPTAAVASPDGSIFVGQDPRDMPGPVDAPIDSVLQIRPDGSTRTFAEGLNSVMGLEWADGTLYVVHAPFLSSFRDEDGDGRAERRVDLVAGFGPTQPAASGLNDHIPSGVRLGMDGFLYVAVGDKGIPRATGRDGKAITLAGGGVVRVRPDGTDLEVVSTGERNPMSVVLAPFDEVFTLGNDDDAHLWPNSLTHHVVGGHYGYPYEFRRAPHRALPIMAGQAGGAGAQGMYLADETLPERYAGNLVFCDWGAQAVARYEIEPVGATYRLKRREAIVSKGDLADFRPFCVAPLAEPGALLVVDWAFNGWLGDGPPTGRLFRLDYTGPKSTKARSRDLGATINDQIVGLDHVDRAVRLASKDLLVRRGAAAVADLKGTLATGKFDPFWRANVLWTLDAIGTPEARAAVRDRLHDPDDQLRSQACRAVGIRRDPLAEPGLLASLVGPRSGDWTRREAAIALGRLPRIAPATRAGLFGRLGDADPTVAWCVRRAIRQAPPDPGNADLLARALADPARRDSALSLADQWYAPEVVRVLAPVADRAGDPAWRARVVAALGGLYARVPAWSGAWYGPNPAAGPRPAATEPWDRASMALVLASLGRAIRDADPGVRRQALVGAIGAGAAGVDLARGLLEPGAEADPANLAAAAQFLGERRDSRGVAPLARILGDAARPEAARMAALDALANLAGPAAINARLAVLYDATSPDALVARALPPLGRARLLPGNDLAGFLDHKSPAVRAAALGAFPTAGRPLGREVVEAILLKRDDLAPEVRLALAEAVARHGLRAAVPWLAEQAKAEDPALRGAATRALAGLPDPAGIPALVAALGERDPELRRSAVAALTPLRDEAAPEVARRAAEGAFTGAGALAAERLLARFRPVPGWEVLAPLPAATGPIFADARAIDFARPVATPGGGSVAWRRAMNRDAAGTIGLDDRDGPGRADAPDGATAFAVAEVESDRDRAALLAVEASGPMFVAVDDKPLANFGAAVLGETIRVPLHAGTNRLLLRLRRAGGPWRARVALSEPGPTAEAEAPAALPALPAVSPVREGLRAVALRTAGDPRRGEALFREVGGIGCARCHAAGGEPAQVAGLGPALDGLAGKYDRAEVVRSILEPSSRLAVGFAPAALALRDGTTATGLVRSEAPDGSVELVDPEGQARPIAAAAIARREAGRASTMPEGLADNLRPVEFADLVAYLMSLRDPRGAGSARP